MENKVKRLRYLLTKYRYEHKDKEVSIHINAVDIALSLLEFYIIENRVISSTEKQWFEASFYLDHILGGSKWEEIFQLYYDLCMIVDEKQIIK